MPSAAHFSPLPASAAPARTSARCAFLITGLAHAVHDGSTDLIYILLRVWPQEFALGYGAGAALRGLYARTMAALQVPAGHLA